MFNTDPLANDTGALNYKSAGEKNLWLLLGRDLKLNHYSDQPQVKHQIEWYMANHHYLERIALQATPYVYYVLQQVKQRHLPSEIALIPMIESNYDPFAYSDDGAAGLWQMMPGTASGYRIRQNWWYDGRRDVYASTQAALNYFVYLNKFFNGNWLLVLAAYNSGEGTVQNAVNYNKRHHHPTDFWDLKLPTQTQNYVPKLLAIATIMANPDKYHVNWPNAMVAPYLTTVNVGSQIDLSVAAKLAGISVKELYELNPGYSRWATDPDGKHLLLLPTDKAQQFETNLAKLPKDQRVTWKRVTVKHGDSLIKIADEYETSARLIKQVNDLNGNLIHVGQTLLIPRERKSFARSVMEAVKHYIHHQRNLPGPNRIVHIVQPGDSLWSIAKAYKLKERDIRFWNHLQKGQPLVPGKQLIIWSQKHAQAYRAARVRPYIIHHTVKAGDSLNNLAKEYHVTVAELKKANKLKSNTIELGHVILIPPTVQKLKYGSKIRPHTYKVKSGDVLGKIAQQYGLSVKALKAANHLTKDTVRVGQVLTLPKAK